MSIKWYIMYAKKYFKSLFYLPTVLRVLFVLYTFTVPHTGRREGGRGMLQKGSGPIEYWD